MNVEALVLAEGQHLGDMRVQPQWLVRRFLRTIHLDSRRVVCDSLKGVHGSRVNRVLVGKRQGQWVREVGNDHAS